MLRWRLFAGAAIAAMLLPLIAKSADRPKAASKPLEVVAEQSARGETLGLTVEQSGYWLGVLVSRPSIEAQARLKLPKDQGLLVERVEPKSPADKAGLQPNDLLLKGNGKALNEVSELVKLLDEVKEGKLTLELLRAGKQEKVVATPAKRPARMTFEALGPEARAWLEKLGPKGGLLSEEQPFKFHIIGPGQILPPGEPGKTKAATSLYTCPNSLTAPRSRSPGRAMIRPRWLSPATRTAGKALPAT